MRVADPLRGYENHTIFIETRAFALLKNSLKQRGVGRSFCPKSRKVRIKLSIIVMMSAQRSSAMRYLGIAFTTTSGTDNHQALDSHVVFALHAVPYCAAKPRADVIRKMSLVYGLRLRLHIIRSSACRKGNMHTFVHYV